MSVTAGLKLIKPCRASPCAVPRCSRLRCRVLLLPQARWAREYGPGPWRFFAGGVPHVMTDNPELAR